jgi:FAD/FMN-containing dehydrogenase
VTEDPTAAALAGVLGRPQVITDPSLCASYGTEPTGRWRGQPRCVALPRTTDEVAAVLRVCAARRAPVVAQGGRTGLVGGGVPGNGEIVLSTARLSRIEPVNLDTAQVTVGAGVTLAAVQSQAQREGLLFGVDFGARDACTVGGMVATNAGGTRVLRWGTMRDQVAGIEAVLSTGETISHLTGHIKDNTGYHLAGLLAGSEGTLGVITRVRLKLRPGNPHHYSAALALGSIGGAVDTLTRLRTSLPTLDAAEIMWSDGIRLVTDVLGVSGPFRDPPPVVLLVDSAGPAEHLDGFAAAVAACPSVRDSVVATTAQGRAYLWEVRDRHGEAVHRLGTPHKFDVTLPPGAIEDFERAVRLLVDRLAPGATTVIFGHLGDGNLHLNVVGPPPDDPTLADAVLRLVAGRGGSISAEHGIGRAKLPWLELNRSVAELAAMRRVRRAWDPAGILNPAVL